VRRLVALLVPLALILVGSDSAPATGPATARLGGEVTGAVSGDTLDVRLASGRTERVRLLGVRAPATGACFSGDSTAEAERLAVGRQVVLRGDRASPARDRAGRLLAYVALPGGADLGRLLVGAGAAQVDVWAPGFARFASYVPVQQGAERANHGLWGACASDLAVTVQGAPEPVVVGARLAYTVRVANRGPLAAQAVTLELRPPAGGELVAAESADGACTVRSWLGRCSVASIASGTTLTMTFGAIVSRPGTVSSRSAVRARWCIRAACANAPLHDSSPSNDQTGLLSTVLAAEPPSQPPPPPGAPPPAPAGGCHPGYPTVCIPPPPPDLDCADIPFRDFYVRRDIPDLDPHDLDGNQDGIGCQFDDY
jgi:endonuclease YncB( thermonuclease family)